ncbi:Slp family lipoprotein [Candidatus Nitrosacidococcus tergens]|uniref:Outer membrane lipoprotein Slp n=1 Tax=Candidatus Nitrosacidococcus tergens TaxID=553981 RepID=A0A7G1Q9R7_9GAMM|nr:Slp family lipoprotein [Candidatus Nitrosacidococcus tergens]CAB1276005.1 Outer membrane lipoprotein Slp [Candidatus Nitrosacidococcus tergens]
MLKKIALIFTALILIGCESQVPQLIRDQPPKNPSIQAVQADVHRYQGSFIRWGGKIASIHNKKEGTVFEILAQPLGDEGRPVGGDKSDGRFIATVAEFLDPEIYKKDREITIYGKVIDLEERKIGELSYPFPVIQTVKYYLWEPITARYYYPYYGGYGGYGGFGFGYPYGYGFGYPYMYPYGFSPFGYYWW